MMREDSEFASWARPTTDEQVAAAAFEYFVTLLHEHGYLPNEHCAPALYPRVAADERT
jgi:hypothetical protein